MIGVSFLERLLGDVAPLTILLLVSFESRGCLCSHDSCTFLDAPPRLYNVTPLSHRLKARVTGS